MVFKPILMILQLKTSIFKGFYHCESSKFSPAALKNTEKKHPKKKPLEKINHWKKNTGKNKPLEKTLEKPSFVYSFPLKPSFCTTKPVSNAKKTRAAPISFK